MMKTIGLLGGMSWESTASYYQLINGGVKIALGGLHSAKIVLVSVDFAEIEKLQHQNNWDKTAIILAKAAQSVEAGGADFLLICTNTMHKVVEQIEAAITIPVLHIADATAGQLVQNGVGCVGLLGTRFTMEEDFFKGRLTQEFGLEVVVPDDEQREQMHRIIYQELCKGVVSSESRSKVLHMIDELSKQGAEAVILGCTEIGLLVSQHQSPVPLYDTTAIHAARAVILATTGTAPNQNHSV